MPDFGVYFQRIIPWLTTKFSFLLVLPPVATFFLSRVRFCCLCEFKLELIYPGETIYKYASKNRMIIPEKKMYVQNTSGGFFTFCRINAYGYEKCRCICQTLLYRLSLILFLYGFALDKLRIIVHNPCY